MKKEQPQIINNFNIAGNYIAEQNIDIHDNTNCSIYATGEPTAENRQPADENRQPAEGDYQAVVAWLEREKAQGNDYYSEAGFNRSKMCRNLSGLFGWIVDQNSLRKAQNK